jgi:hypothetical protein
MRTFSPFTCAIPQQIAASASYIVNAVLSAARSCLSQIVFLTHLEADAPDPALLQDAGDLMDRRSRQAAIGMNILDVREAPGLTVASLMHNEDGFA